MARYFRHDDINFLNKLETGIIRAAYQIDGLWYANKDVKNNILNIFKNSHNTNIDYGCFSFIDKTILQPRKFTLDHNIRIIPGGTTVRRGAFIGNNVVVMPPSYINIGAYIDNDTMIDSNVLIGSCAQIGKKVHISAGTQVCGVLEPIQNNPVIIEDECFVGANSTLAEGVIIKKRAVIGANVCITASTPIYDVINKKILYGIIPENAVVISGSRPLNSDWDISLSITTPVIIKYRDNTTESKIALEAALRGYNS